MALATYMTVEYILRWCFVLIMTTNSPGPSTWTDEVDYIGGVHGLRPKISSTNQLTAVTVNIQIIFFEKVRYPSFLALNSDYNRDYWQIDPLLCLFGCASLWPARVSNANIIVLKQYPENPFHWLILVTKSAFLNCPVCLHSAMLLFPAVWLMTTWRTSTICQNQQQRALYAGRTGSSMPTTSASGMNVASPMVPGRLGGVTTVRAHVMNN